MGRPPRKVRSAVRSTTFVDRAVTALWAVHSGFWLGMLDTDELDEATLEFYGDSTQFLAADHNLRGLAPWEQGIVDRYAPPGSKVLVPATGAGREIIALAAQGFDATGYDPTPELVETGQKLIAEQGLPARLLLSYGNDLPAGLDPPYDWAMFGWGSISHIVGRDTRVAVFGDLFDLVAPGGVFAVSFLPRTAGSLRYNLTYKVAKTVRDLRRSSTPVELGDTLDGSFDHRFTFDEVLRELTAAGFAELDRVGEPYPHVICRRP